jgi:UDP-2,4-diacetamido-2,4,6-trideoxy-beta-L-altropyranose hydrolase
MRIAFRADASARIGAGHVVRCATLAQELASRGAEICFFSREMNGHYLDWLREKGFDVEALPATESINTDSFDTHSGWLCAQRTQEIVEMSELLRSREPVDWLITDHYAIDRGWHSVLRPFVHRIMCIDDLANRPHDCDILLDQNLHSSSERRYVNLVPESAKTLLGPRYALLRPEFAACRRRPKARDGVVRRVFVFMGGGDTTSLTDTVLMAFSQSRYRAVAMDVVMGVKPCPAYTRIMQSKLPNVQFHYRVVRIAELMMQADLAIGASGVATWERAAVGLPALVVSVAENQRAIARNAHEAGMLTWIDSIDPVSRTEWLEHIDDAFSSPERLRRQSEACLALIDAKGVQRVADAMQ